MYPSKGESEPRARKRFSVSFIFIGLCRRIGCIRFGYKSVIVVLCILGLALEFAALNLVTSIW